jgi:hypothetical protein
MTVRVLVVKLDEAVLVYFKLKYPELWEEDLSDNKESAILAEIR